MTKLTKKNCSPKELFKMLNNIRQDGAKAFDKRERIAQVVREELKKQGKFIKTYDERAYYFFDSTHKLFEIHKDNEQFCVLLYKLARLNKADCDWNFIFNELRNYALAHGQESTVWQFTRFQDGKLYISRFDGQVYVLDGENIVTVTNGTDGVLFLDRLDWESWETKDSGGDFTLSEFIGQINFDVVEPPHDGLTIEEYRQLFVTCLLSLFFIDLLPTSYLLLFLGPKGSGKTSIIRRVGKLIFGSKFDVKVLDRSKEDAFTVLVARHFLVAIDNVDTSIPWLCDRLATIATGSGISMRELYTTANECQIFPRCFVWLSSRTPHFRRDDIAQRLLILRVKMIGKGKNISERQLYKQIAKNRNALLGELLQKLNEVIAYLKTHDINKETVEFRLADFATLSKAIWEALGGKEAGEAWENILSKMQVEQEDFALEGDTLPFAILEWMGKEKKKGPVDPSTLYSDLKESAENTKMELNYKNSLAVGRRLSSIKSTLQERLGIRIIETKGRANRTLRTFEKINQDE